MKLMVEDENMCDNLGNSGGDEETPWKKICSKSSKKVRFSKLTYDPMPSREKLHQISRKRDEGSKPQTIYPENPENMKMTSGRVNSHIVMRHTDGELVRNSSSSSPPHLLYNRRRSLRF